MMWLESLNTFSVEQIQVTDTARGRIENTGIAALAPLVESSLRLLVLEE